MSTRVALDIIGRGEIDVAPILTHRFPFRDVLDAYQLQRTRGDGAVKIVVDLEE
jgi:threonine dehydrogenase-like Zn-dependent dehydrogenase